MSKNVKKTVRNVTSILGFLAGVLVVLAFVGFVLARERKPVPSVNVASAPAAATSTMDESSVPRVNVAEAQQLIAAGKVTVIDVRDIDGYRDAHIAGALHIPLARIDGEVPYLPRDNPILTYCTCPAEESSAQAALILHINGFDASCLVGGLAAWKNAGGAMRTGETQ
jgi:rhodanese-related sulfurtransferase